MMALVSHASPPMASLAPPSDSGKDSDYSYAVVTMAAIAIMLIVSNIIAYTCCCPLGLVHGLRRFIRSHEVPAIEAAYHPAQELIPVCKYRKDEFQGYLSDSECSVCLTAFMEGEDVRQLPRCKHSFHAPCIDMWLYSHSNCPLCRARVLALPLRYMTNAVREETREVDVVVVA